ncbi:hypothetical protein CONPUDRAFT_73182 [Coniophora puteana RWD-64-598 SS2]|uniref:Uncharacterized protein n=1 Tax=Coniophora puteana (strain RWD-64-598) TaxID=741705 RepID=A0A5M3MQW9_CONPW|nr:uncharacterized protein CONPUDRAFT_73182 [Coniophora puteana RWD-64-598 SS2]EIW81456.1 hypothetical protein CONPUDRAFT_73182 [Coniophora puteana RWD-64-598 SS2]
MNSSDMPLDIGTYLAGVLISILYGADICMYITSLHLLQKNPQAERLWIGFYTSFGGILLLMLTVQLFTTQYLACTLYLKGTRNLAESAYSDQAALNSWSDVLETVATIIANWMGDGLMRQRANCDTAVSFVTLVEKALTSNTILTGVGNVFNIAWAASTVAFNVSVSSMICWRLLSTYWILRDSVPGHRDVRKKYTGMVSLIVEGTIPFAILAVMSFILELYDNQLSITIIARDIWCSVCVFSQQLIILRISMGTAWTRDTVIELTESQVGRRFDEVFEAQIAKENDV